MAKVKTTKEQETVKADDFAEIFESSEALQEQVIGRTETFAKNNKNVLYAVLIIIALGVGGFLFYQSNLETQDKAAQLELFPAIFFFEQDSLSKAVNGDGNTTLGLKAIVEEYGSTKSGNLAKIYLGTYQLRSGEFDNAIATLKDFSSSDFLVQARVYSLIGDAYLEKGETASAIDFYKKATDYNTNKVLSIDYLFKLATAYKAKGDNKAAKDVYQRVISDFPESNRVLEAKKNVASLN
jgi:predicted negative regulator of RcsB-dependent stress response